MLREIEVSLPPGIHGQGPNLPSAVAAQIEEAAQQAALLDSAHAGELDALGVMLLRTESVASSKIEGIEASIDDFARALRGSKANASATSMAAATAVLEEMIAAVTANGTITLEMLTRAHAELMSDDPGERPYAGRLRTVQNWIGGSDHSPQGADYIPPPPDRVPDLIDDLLRYCARNDLPALAQAALAHAQFESIHPFTDGNGRIGRGLVNAILRRRGLTTGVVIPLASALVANRDAYFDMLDAYRSGEIEPILVGFTQATTIAARESRVTAHNLSEIPGEWRDRLGRVRRGGTTYKLLDLLPRMPVLTAKDADELIAAPTSSVYSAIARLSERGILRELTNRRRNQIFGATDILAELADLDLRIGRAAKPGPLE